MDDPSIYEWSFRRRDEERAVRAEAKLKISAADARVENCPQGVMRWYLHPEIASGGFKSMIVYRYEIPPGGFTGKQHRQGNMVSFVVQGHGHTVVNKAEHRWAAGDVIALPPLLDGVEYQHFNDSDEVALLVTAEPNHLDMLGVEAGCGLDQLSAASTWQQAAEG